MKVNAMKVESKTQLETLINCLNCYNADPTVSIEINGWILTLCHKCATELKDRIEEIGLVSCYDK